MTADQSQAPSSGGAGRHDHLRVWRELLAGPGRYVRPWYVAYLLLGIVTSGMVPVLLPLMMVDIAHKLSSVAYVMGVYDFGLLTSPLWGTLAERFRIYRGLFFFAFIIAALAIAVFPLMHGMTGWMAAAFVLGAGSSGAATVASLFIVDFAPQGEWEPRIGLLQSFNGAGQVVGLLLAGIFSHGRFDAGLWLAALLLVPAVVLGGIGLPLQRAPHASGAMAHRILDVRALATFPHVNLPSGLGFHFHHFNMHGLRHLPEIVGTPFGRFLLSWFMLALGVAGFFTYFPLMLEHGYGLNSHLSSLIYAVGATVGIALFLLASRWAARFGSGRVYQAGLWLRLIGFVLLVLPYLVPATPHLPCAAGGFLLIVIAWPILSVAGTGLAATLAPFSEGAAMGLFNAALALATVIGAFVSGPLMQALGYRSIAWMGIIGLLLAIVLGTACRRPPALLVRTRNAALAGPAASRS
jgi:Arabinose efflux permease